MLRSRSLLCHRAFSRAYATPASPHALVFLEHRQGVLDSGSLSALTAAQQLGGKISALVVGGPDQVPSIVEQAKKCVYWRHQDSLTNVSLG
jgi:electron transfer flavoprotein alpha subunit